MICTCNNGRIMENELLLLFGNDELNAYKAKAYCYCFIKQFHVVELKKGKCSGCGETDNDVIEKYGCDHDQLCRQCIE